MYPPTVDESNLKAKIPEEQRIRPHALRHTYGTERYINGVPPKELADVMGHKSIHITMNMYAHLATERSRDTINESYRRAFSGSQ